MVALVTKMANKLDFKYRNRHFGPNLSLLETIFFKELGISTAKYKKPFKYVVCRDNTHHFVKYLFGICLSSMSIGLSNVSNFLQNNQFSFSANFGGHFFTIATAKVELIPDIYTWAPK